MKNIFSFRFMLLVFFIMSFYLESQAKNRQEERPNVIIITCHDIGQHLGCYGVETVQTPNIDHLAEKGIVFRNAYSTSAVCSPGRGSLHTGRYPQSNGLMGLTHAPWWWRLNEDERHTAQILNENGYTTYLIGLNHVDPDPKRLGYQHVPLIAAKGEAGITQTAVDIIENLHPDSTVFIKIGFHLAHRPFKNNADSAKGVFVPPYLANTKEMREDLSAFQAEINYLDKQIGEILAAIHNSKIADNTLVVFTSDHGIPYPGAKWSLRRAGIQVPLIMFKPNSAFSQGKLYFDIFSNVDFLPTLLSFLKIVPPGNLQGMDFMPYIEEKIGAGPRKYAFAQYTTDMKRDNVSRCIITNHYHMIRYFDQGRSIKLPINIHPQRFASHLERMATNGPRPFVQLYDIQNDPFELEDKGGEEGYAAIEDELSSALLHWMKEVNDQLLSGPQKTPYYEKAIIDLMRYNDHNEN